MSKYFYKILLAVRLSSMGKSKERKGIAVNGNPSHSYKMSLAIWDHTVLPATRHKWTHPTLTPAIQAGTRLTYPGGMESWVDLGVLLHTEWFTRPKTVSHPSTNWDWCRLTSLISQCRQQVNHTAKDSN